MCKQDVSKVRNQQSSSVVKIFKTKTVRLTAPVLVVAGWLAMTASSMAVTTSYANDYRVCTARLLNLQLTPQAASQGCAKALRPRDLSACVVKINQQTQISAVDALASCNRARRPQELANCVTGISRNTPEAIKTPVLDYCGRSLLPERFALCVVGLRSEIELAPVQAMDTCIDASDRVSGFSPASAPPTRVPTESSPSFEVNPIPGNPASE
ncbi:MAG: hypothetical protein AB3A66_17035 [Nodularia sp. CChRGM 3473]